MSKKDLEDFQKKYGYEYDIHNSPVARWVAEHGCSQEEACSLKKKAQSSLTLRELLKLNTGKQH